MISTWTNFLFESDLWVESWIKRDSWTILFCVMHFRLFYRFENARIVLERLWLGLDKGFDKRWKSHGSIIVTKQITNGSWTNKIRHYIIVCRVRPVTTRESIISIQRDFLEFGLNLKEFWILFVILKRPNIFRWPSLTNEYRLNGAGQGFLSLWHLPNLFDMLRQCKKISSQTSEKSYVLGITLLLSHLFNRRLRLRLLRRLNSVWFSTIVKNMNFVAMASFPQRCHVATESMTLQTINHWIDGGV